MKVLVHENGDLNITPFIKVDWNNIAKIALSSPIDNYRDEKCICIIQLVQKVSLEKIMDSVEARSFADGKEWIKNYFKKKSKDGAPDKPVPKPDAGKKKEGFFSKLLKNRLGKSSIKGEEI